MPFGVCELENEYRIAQKLGGRKKVKNQKLTSMEALDCGTSVIELLHNTQTLVWSKADDRLRQFGFLILIQSNKLFYNHFKHYL